MTTENYYKDIKHIVRIRTNIGKSCEHCDASIGFREFAKSVNHYIEQHKYKLLHIGQETGRNEDDGSPFHSTVAIVGK